MRRLPDRNQIVGLIVGFVGVVTISGLTTRGGETTGAGIVLVVLATLLYGCAYNLAGPLQRRGGALPVIWRAQLVSLVVLAPLGGLSLPSSNFAWSSLLATIALGAVSTALAYVGFATLVGQWAPPAPRSPSICCRWLRSPSAGLSATNRFTGSLWSVPYWCSPAPT